MTELESASTACERVLDQLERMSARLDRMEPQLATLLEHSNARLQALTDLDQDKIQIERDGDEYVLWIDQAGISITKEIYDMLFDLAATTGHERVVR